MNTDIEFYRRQFYQEAREILENLSENTLRLEVNPQNRELINSIFRGVHTIKGSAGSFELDDISSFSHYFEEVLSRLRDGLIEVDTELIDLILSGIDHLLELVAGYEKGTPIEVNQSLVEKFKNLLSTKEEKGKVEEKEDEVKYIEEDIPEDISSILQRYKQDGLSVYKLLIKYDSETFRNGYDPLILLKNIKDSSSFYKAYTNWQDIPKISNFNPYELYLSPTVYIATTLSKEEIEDFSFDKSLIELFELDLKPKLEESLEEPQQELLKEFQIEVQEMIANLESSALEYEKTRSTDALNSIFRVVHTIKGDSSYLGLKEIAEFTHTFESFLERLRSGKLTPEPKYADIILMAIDDLKGLIYLLSLGEKVSIPSSYDLIKRYILDEPKVQLDIDLSRLSDEELSVFIFEIQQYRDILLNFGRSLDREKAIIIERALNGLRKLFKFFKFNIIEDLLYRGEECIKNEDYDVLPDILKDIGDILNRIEEKSQTKPKEEKVEGEELASKIIQEKKIQSSEVEQQPIRQPKETQEGILRIDEKKIDQLSNLIGELVVARNTYEYLLNELLISNNSNQTLWKSFKDNFYLISRLTNEINQSVASLRMVPLRGVFSRFTRVVRDISRKENKKIRLITDGEDTEVDKKIADVLSEPLIHLVRNACDHGIEIPQERIKVGKPEEGTVILRASQEGTNLIIKVIDDGKGIDRRAIYEKAVSLGIKDLPSIDDSEIFNLIFLPGFSTKKEVTDISGRGVGMDVVKNAIVSLGGRIDINSKEGEGTEITLTIPTSIGITLALMVEMDGDIYAIPMEYIVETMKVPIENLRRLHDRIGFYYRGDILPIERLDNLLNRRTCEYTSVRDFIKDKTMEEVPLVIVKVSKGKYGIMVDRLLKNMEITIKSMPDSISNIDIFSGVSISGDGKIVLVLNPEKLV